VGDTVQVPAGNCTWSALTLTKAVHLRGAGKGQTNITLAGGLGINKQPSAVVRVSRFTFIASGSGNASVAVSIAGPWDYEPVVVQDNEFRVNFTALFRVESPGGFIAARNTIAAGQDDSLFQLKDDVGGEASWQAADTLGARDTNGRRNHYIEDNTIRGGTNQGVDCDDGARCVYRYNTLTYSSFNSHGYESSPVGMRHFEIYNNTWLYPTNDAECRSASSDSLANQNWLARVRGATGVVFGNTMPDIATLCNWGAKPEIKLDIRAAQDETPRGVNACFYPIPRQLGQNFNGTAYFTDPIYIWGNIGNPEIGQGYDDSWGPNPCGQPWSFYFKSGRDYVTGVAKPGYTAYPHPHPLVLATP
jgi:hypothetical protein